MVLEQSIDTLPNTSSITIRRLKSLGIETYWDLLNYFPFRYEDYSVISPIMKMQEGEQVTIQGTIIQSQNIFTRTGLKIQKILVQDSTGTIEVNWYNQPYLVTLLHPDLFISASGQAKRIGKKMILLPKEYELLSELNTQTKHTGRIVPMYSEKKGLSSKTIREKIFYLLNNFCADRSKSCIPEIFSTDIISYNNLIDELSAYQNIHFPDNLEILKKARERLSFDELFIMQLTSKLVKKEWEKESVGNQFRINTSIEKAIDVFIKSLPFILTNAQKKVTGEILDDIQRIKPMNRFLQGEVGSGKTVVATIACYVSFLNGFQSLFMAPTEILAEQHYKTLNQLFSSTSLKVELITGAKKPLVKDLEAADIIIGTHALIQGKRSFKKVGLVVIDEQHRFGVMQRAKLKNKGLNPHLLTMTATPIPRTVMLTLYGELDISILDEMPQGRQPIKTYFIPLKKRNACYEWIKKQIDAKHSQIYSICPLIEESENETMQSVKAAKKEYEYLKNKIFTDYSVGLLHGKLISKEKNQIMQGFVQKKYDILIATPVVEVGIDVPSATIMIIEGAERFGLAQLHQLRGRVGRGKEQSYCFLFSEKEDTEISQRLVYFTKTQDGNLLAQKDLEIRGPGNLYGTKQHGYLELKLASLTDFPMIEKTRKAVDYFIGHYKLEEFNELKRRVEILKVGQISRD